MDLPSGRFDVEALTTQNLFESVHRSVHLKVIRLAVCGTKDINIGGSGLAIISYAS